jgi:tetratricopeptide (TPR) repeat protein
MLSGERERAVELFRTAMSRAIEDGPNAVRTVTADLRRMMKDQSTIDRAITLFSDTPARGPLTRANDRILVRLYRRAEDNATAVEVLERLTASATDDADRAALYAEKGEVLHVMNEYDAARDAYEQSLRYGPGNWITLNNLAYLLSDAMKQNEKAIEYARKAVATVENSATLDTLGWIYVGLGDNASAVAELSRAVRLDPNSSLIHYHLGEAYRRNGQFAEATDVLQSARGMATAGDDVERLAAVDESIRKVKAADTSP